MFQDYPKWINDPNHPDGGFVVFDAEEEEKLKPKEEEVKRKPGRPKKVQE